MLNAIHFRCCVIPSQGSYTHAYTISQLNVNCKHGRTNTQTLAHSRTHAQPHWSHIFNRNIVKTKTNIEVRSGQIGSVLVVCVRCASTKYNHKLTGCEMALCIVVDMVCAHREWEREWEISNLIQIAHTHTHSHMHKYKCHQNMPLKIAYHLKIYCDCWWKTAHHHRMRWRFCLFVLVLKSKKSHLLRIKRQNPRPFSWNRRDSFHRNAAMLCDGLCLTHLYVVVVVVRCVSMYFYTHTASAVSVYVRSCKRLHVCVRM